MRRFISFTALMLLCALPTSQVLAQSSNADPALGVWTNPKGTVKVQTRECAGNLCGWIIWVDDKAAQDARKAGATSLIGTQLLYDYHVAGAKHWAGEVYVPDMGMRLSSKIALVDQDNIKISGCIMGGLLCKSQVWHRALGNEQLASR